MFLVDNPEKLVEVTKAIYAVLRERLPQYADRFTEEKAVEAATNESTISRYKKAVEINKQRQQAYQNHQEFKKELGITKQSVSLVRFGNEMSRPGNDPASVEYNKKLASDSRSENTIMPTVIGALDKFVNNNIFAGDFSITGLMNSYMENAEVYNTGFVAKHVINELDTYKLTPFMDDFFRRNMAFIQGTAIFSNSVQLSSNIYSIIIPEDIRCELITSSISESIRKVVQPYIDEGFEDFPQEVKGATNEQTLSAYSANAVKYLFDKERNQAFSNYLAKNHIYSSNKLMLNYYFIDASGNKINSSIAMDKVAEGKENEIVLKEYSPEEKKAIVEGLKNPYITALSNDDKKREELLMEFSQELIKANPELNSVITDEVIQNKLANSQRDIELHKKAVGIIKINNEKKRVLESIQNSLKIEHIDSGFGRIANTYMKLPNTGQNKEYNTNIVKQLSTREGTVKFANEEINKLLHLNVKDAFAKSPLDFVNNYDSYVEKFRCAFVFDSIISNGMYNRSSKFHDFAVKNQIAIQQLAQYKGAVEVYANPLYLITPEVDYSKHGEHLATIMAASQAVLDNHKGETTDLSGELTKNTLQTSVTYSSQFLDMQSNAKFNEKFAEKVENKVIDEHPFLNNYILGPNNEHLKLGEFIKEEFPDNKNVNMSNCKVCKCNEEEKKIVEKLITNPFKDERLDFVKEQLAKKEQLLNMMSTIENAKAKIAFFNSKAYNDMVDSFQGLKDVLNDPKYSDPTNILSTGQTVSEMTLEIFNALKMVHDAADAYITAKEHQSKNATRQLRYDTAKSLCSTINIEKCIADKKEASVFIKPLGDLIENGVMQVGDGYPLDVPEVKDEPVEKQEQEVNKEQPTQETKIENVNENQVIEEESSLLDHDPKCDEAIYIEEEEQEEFFKENGL